MSDVPLWKGQPITPGWWWLQFSDQPGPRYWDGTFWKQGSYFAGAEDYAEFPILGPCPLPMPELPASPQPTRAMFSAEAWAELEYSHEILNAVVRKCVALITGQMIDPGDLLVCLGAIVATSVHKGFPTRIDRRAALRAVTSSMTELLDEIEEKNR